MQVFLGKAQLDIEAILTKQRILLKSIPRGTAKIVFTARDFGHFLAHPLLRQAAATAVQVFISHGQLAVLSHKTSFKSWWQPVAFQFILHNALWLSTQQLCMGRDNEALLAVHRV